MTEKNQLPPAGAIVDEFPEPRADLGSEVVVYLRLQPAKKTRLLALRQAVPTLLAVPLAKIVEMAEGGERIFLKRCWEYDLEDLRIQFRTHPVEVEVEEAK